MVPLSPPSQGHPSHAAPRKPTELVARGDMGRACPWSVPRPPLPGDIWPWDQPRVNQVGKQPWDGSGASGKASPAPTSAPAAGFWIQARSIPSLSKDGNVWMSCGISGVPRNPFPLGMFHDFVNKMMDATLRDRKTPHFSYHMELGEGLAGIPFPAGHNHSLAMPGESVPMGKSTQGTWDTWDSSPV